MRKAFAPLFLCLAALTCAPLAHAQAMTEAMAAAWQEAIDQAIVAHDSAAVGRLLADEVQITGEAVANGVRQSFHLDKRTYLAALDQQWQTASNYTYRGEGRVIRLEGEQAVITGTVIESRTVGDLRTATTRTASTTTLIVRDGKPLAIRLEGKVKMRRTR